MSFTMEEKRAPDNDISSSPLAVQSGTSSSSSQRVRDDKQAAHLVIDDDKDKDRDGDELDEVFAHLPAPEREVLKRQLAGVDPKVSFVGLYRYATKIDVVTVIISALCAIAAGAALPLFTVK